MGVNICIAPQRQMFMLSWVVLRIESEQWKRKSQCPSADLNPLRVPSWCWVCRGTPPALVLFSVGPMDLLPFKPLLPLPAVSSCASSPVSEVPVVLLGNYALVRKLRFCGKTTLCGYHVWKAAIFWLPLKSCFGTDSLSSTTLCFALSPNDLKQCASVFKSNAKCTLPEIHIYLSAVDISPDASAHWLELFSPFLLDLKTIINSIIINYTYQ